MCILWHDEYLTFCDRFLNRYCNSRIISYHANGVIKEILGNLPIDNQMLFVPHSLALDADERLLYVADRENHRIVSIETLNGKVRVFSGVFGLGRVFGLGFSGVGEGGWPLMTISETDSGERGYGVALGAGGGIELLWGTSQVSVWVFGREGERVCTCIFYPLT